jgi:hypothetical protein
MATGLGAIIVVIVMDVFRELKGKHGVEGVLAFSLGAGNKLPFN